MAARYSKVLRRTWVDDRVRKLTPIPACGAGLWMRMLTGPELTNIPGLFPAWEAGLAQALGWSLKGFRESYQECFREGLIEACWEHGLVWVPNAIKHNKPQNPNVVKSWGPTWSELPDCHLKGKAYRRLSSYLETLPESYLETFANECPNLCPNQEQEQEQEDLSLSDKESDGEKGAKANGKAAEVNAQIARLWTYFGAKRKQRYPKSRTLEISSGRESNVRARIKNFGVERIKAAIDKFFDRRYFWGSCDAAKNPELLFKSVAQFEKVENASTYTEPDKGRSPAPIDPRAGKYDHLPEEERGEAAARDAVLAAGGSWPS